MRELMMRRLDEEFKAYEREQMYGAAVPHHMQRYNFGKFELGFYYSEEIDSENNPYVRINIVVADFQKKVVSELVQKILKYNNCSFYVFTSNEVEEIISFIKELIAYF